jgi:hypothetical protein
MQDRSKSKSRAEILFISSKLRKSFGGSFKKKLIKSPLVLEDDGIKNIRNGKYHMKVSDIEQIAFLRVNPAFLCKRLTLGTMPVATGVVRDLSKSAISTYINMTSQSGSPAFFYG